MKTRAIFLRRFAAAAAITALTIAFVPTVSSAAGPSARIVRDGCEGSVPTIIGTEGDDVLVGTPGDDIIYGLGGNDVIRGRGGNDSICGGEGNDKLYGHGGNDIINGGPGNDQIFGRSGDDQLAGGPGADVIRGGSGEDNLEGDAGNDTLIGGSGPDRLAGANGDDLLRGGPGNDAISGGIGNDEPRGGAGNDTCETSDAQGARCEIVQTVTYTEVPVKLVYQGQNANPDFSTGGIAVYLHHNPDFAEPGIGETDLVQGALGGLPVAVYDVTGTEFTVSIPSLGGWVSYQNSTRGQELGYILGSGPFNGNETGPILVDVTDVVYIQ